MTRPTNQSGMKQDGLEERLRVLALEKSYLQLVNNLINHLGEATGLEQVTDAILRSVLDNLGGANIALYYQVGLRLHYADVFGVRKVVGTVEDPMVRAAFERREFIEEVREFSDTRMATPAFTRSSNWALPLLVGDQLVGVLKTEGMLMSAAEIRHQLRPFFHYAALVLKNETQSHLKLMEVSQLAAIVHCSDDAVISKDLTGVILSWNQGAENIYGYTEQEMVGRPMALLLPDGREDELPQILAQIGAGKHIRHYETVRRCKDGRLIQVSLTISPIRDAQGVVVAASTIGRDITARKQAERRLALVDFALSRVREAAYLIAEDSHFQYVNDESCRVLGYRREELLGFRVADINPNFPPERWPQQWRDVRAQGSLTFESSHRAKDGRLIPVEVAANYFEYGGTPYILALVRDITERRRAEAERQEHLRFFECMDRVNRAIQGAGDLDRMMGDVLDVVLAIFECDRVWLAYPCDPATPRFGVQMERTQPEYVRTAAETRSIPCDADIARVFRAVLATGGPVQFGPGTGRALPAESAARYRIRSLVALALHPKHGQPWIFGLHQCSRTRMWTPAEEQLLQEIGRRVTDAVTSMLAFRELQESEQNFRLLFETMLQGAVAQDAAGQIISANPAAERILGLGAPELAGQTSVDLETRCLRADGTIFPGEEHPAMVALRTGREVRDVVMGVYNPRDRCHRWISIDAVPVLRPGQDRPEVVYTVFSDITEKKRADEALHSSRAELAAIYEHAPIVMGLLDENLRLLRANDATARFAERALASLLDHTPGEVLGCVHVTAQGCGNAAECSGCCLRGRALDTLATGRTHSGVEAVLDLRRKEGVKKVSVVLHTARVVVENRPRVLLCVEDVTARREAEAALRESERNYRLLAENISDVIWILDLDTLRFRYVSPSVQRLRGYTVEEALDQGLSRTIAPESLAQIKDLMPGRIARFLEGRDEVFTDQVSFRHRNGEMRWMETVSRVRRNEDDGRLEAYGVSRDVTERRRAQEALSESEERFRQVTESIEEVFWLTDPERREMIYISPAYEKIWGRTCASLYASPRSWLEAVHPEERDRVRGEMQRQPPDAYDTEYRIVRPDGSVRWIRDRAFPVRDQQGPVHRLAGVATDITAWRQLEERLRQAQKMEAIGQFAGGIAHDFNNLLSAIQLQGSLLLTETNVASGTREGVQNILTAAERAANLTRQILTFSRRSIPQTKDLDLGELVGNMVKLLRRVLGEDITLETRWRSRLPAVHADPGMLEQLLMNLAVNARDAMRDGGRLSIAIEPVEIDATRASSHPGVEPGTYLRLEMGDTGCGIPPEHLPHIFEPFYTTKEVGKGTGLGLATVYGIVQQHAGWIEVNSRPGAGTVFGIYLPARARGTGASAGSPRVPAVRGGTETILLVEDDTIVRTLARTILERSGYHVLEADSGPAALHLWQGLEKPVDLLFTDLVMPGGMSGRELAEKLAALQPGLKTIYSSGYSYDMANHALHLDREKNFLRKPFTAQELAIIVRHRLDEPD